MYIEFGQAWMVELYICLISNWFRQMVQCNIFFFLFFFYTWRTGLFQKHSWLLLLRMNGVPHPLLLRECLYPRGLLKGMCQHPREKVSGQWPYEKYTNDQFWFIRKSQPELHQKGKANSCQITFIFAFSGFLFTQSTPGGCGNEKKNPGDLPAPAPKRE